MKAVPLNPIFLAVKGGDRAALDALIEGGLRMDYRTESDHWNLLHWPLVGLSQEHPPQPAMIAYLIQLGVDVNAKDRIGWTPLHYAARGHRLEIVRLLLAAGAEVNAGDDKGITPLHLHLLQRPVCLELIELLLQFGADPSANHPGPNARKFIRAIASPEKPEIEALFAKYSPQP